MAYIDKDKALNLDFKINVSLFESRRKMAERAVQAYADAISAIPAADVRPVVLCRDCMMRQYCKVAQYLGADGFCSNGEKRES